MDAVGSVDAVGVAVDASVDAVAAVEVAVTSLDAGANRLDSGVVAAPDAAGAVATAGSVEDGT